MEGRYVTLRLPGSKKILTLCEVEVLSIEYGNNSYHIDECGSSRTCSNQLSVVNGGTMREEREF